MSHEAEMGVRLWKALEAHPVIMLGVHGSRDGHAQPMTASIGGPLGPLWFFTTRSNGLVLALGTSNRGMAHYVAKGHELFATIHGKLSIDEDRETIDALWTPHLAEWYAKGREDPSVCLLRLDMDHAMIWRHAGGMGTAIKRIFGHDHRADYQDELIEIAL